MRAEGAESTIELWLSRPFVDRHEIRTVHPEPADVRADTDRIIYEFDVEDGHDAVEIAFDVLPDGIGSNTGHVGLVDGASVTLRQFILP